MKKLILLITLLSINIRCFSQEFETVQSGKDSKVIKVMNSNNEYIALTFKKINIKSYLNSNDYFQKFTSDKKKLLSLMNIKNWNISEQTKTTLGTGNIFTFRGSYIDYKEQKIVFKEKHLLKNNILIQLLHTATMPSKNISDAKLLELINQFDKEIRNE